MAEHLFVDAATLNGAKIDKGHSHQTGVSPDINSLDEKNGASHTTSLHDLANKEHDTEAHFTTAPKNMRAHLPVVSKEK